MPLRPEGQFEDEGTGPEINWKGSESDRKQMTHRNEEVCSKPGGLFQVAAELNLSFPMGCHSLLRRGQEDPFVPTRCIWRSLASTALMGSQSPLWTLRQIT